MRWITRILWVGLCLLSGPAWAKRPEIVVNPGGVVPEALQAITEAVDAIARLAEDQDGGEIERLRRRARDASLAALATQGYFAPTVTLTSGTDVGGETWDIVIEPGKRAMVATVDLQFTGRILRPEYAERLKKLRADWPLKAGQPFVNSVWNKAKADLLNQVTERDFLLARVTRSKVDVRTDAAQAFVHLTIDSGPQIHLGALESQGLQRVPASLLQRYVRYSEGADYDQSQLDQWQQALQSTTFFRGAFVELVQPGGMKPVDLTSSSEGVDGEETAEAATPAVPTEMPSMSADVAIKPGATPALSYDSNGELTLPVRVRVVEAPPKRLTATLGVDSDAGVRTEAVYRQNVVFGLPLTLDTGVGADRLRQRIYADVLMPPTASGYKDSIGVLADHSDIQGLEVTRYALGATRLKESKGTGRVEYETRWGLLLAQDRVRIAQGDSYNLPSLTATTEWLRRDVDDKYNPREGNLISLGGGVGLTLDTRHPYTRARVRAQQWWPVGERDVLTVRGELGRVWARENLIVPDDFGFRTGGARTIRGYKYQSFGVQRNGAVVGAPTLLVGSVEYDHYFTDRWGMGVFVDAGDAAQSFGDMSIAVGYGVGARVRTPAGPLFLDVAYGQRDRSLKLNFSLGIAF